jgi:hypothetical protein
VSLKFWPASVPVPDFSSPRAALRRRNCREESGRRHNVGAPWEARTDVNRVAAQEILIGTSSIAAMVRDGKTLQIPSAMPSQLRDAVHVRKGSGAGRSWRGGFAHRSGCFVGATPCANEGWFSALRKARACLPCLARGTRGARGRRPCDRPRGQVARCRVPPCPSGSRRAD